MRIAIILNKDLLNIQRRMLSERVVYCSRKASFKETRLFQVNSLAGDKSIGKIIELLVVRTS